MKKTVSVFLALLLLFGTVSFSLTAAAQETPTPVAEGTCGAADPANGLGGDCMRWTLYSDGTLIISGTGEMEFCFSFNPIWSWYGDYKETGQMPVPIKKIVIEPGIDNITAYAFSYATELESIVIPSSVTRIGRGAFEACDKLKDVYYDGSKAQWQQIDIETANNEALFKAAMHYAVSDTADDVETSVFQRILQWFRDLFDKIAAWFRF